MWATLFCCRRGWTEPVKNRQATIVNAYREKKSHRPLPLAPFLPSDEHRPRDHHFRVSQKCPAARHIDNPACCRASVDQDGCAAFCNRGHGQRWYESRRGTDHRRVGRAGTCHAGAKHEIPHNRCGHFLGKHSDRAPGRRNSDQAAGYDRIMCHRVCETGSWEHIAGSFDCGLSATGTSRCPTASSQGCLHIAFQSTKSCQSIKGAEV